MFEKELPSFMYKFTGEMNDKQHQQIHTKKESLFFLKHFFKKVFIFIDFL